MRQTSLFPLDTERPEVSPRNSTTFTNNMRLPVHRWFRFSAGFSAAWAKGVIFEAGPGVRVLDPFAGSGTTLLAAEEAGAEAMGVEAHPLIARIAAAKLDCRTPSIAYRTYADKILKEAKTDSCTVAEYPDLVHRCFPKETLSELDALRRVIQTKQDESPVWRLAWLTLVSILRPCSPSGTAQWQYILPNKSKKTVARPYRAFATMIERIADDMQWANENLTGSSRLVSGDARDCKGIPDDYATLVVTSPPYANNYDYADSTRLEMCFLREISGWSDLQTSVRKYLVRACTQHVTSKTVDLNRVLSESCLEPISSELAEVCDRLAAIRLTKGGKKNYHLMIACYFHDLAEVWVALRRVCANSSRVCFVVGDSAPYGVYVPVIEWLGQLAEAAGFKSWRFEKTRDRNIKWKNRKHRVPLCEGRLWVEG